MAEKERALLIDGPWAGEVLDLPRGNCDLVLARPKSMQSEIDPEGWAVIPTHPDDGKTTVRYRRIGSYNGLSSWTHLPEEKSPVVEAPAVLYLLAHSRRRLEFVQFALADLPWGTTREAAEWARLSGFEFRTKYYGGRHWLLYDPARDRR